MPSITEIAERLQNDNDFRTAFESNPKTAMSDVGLDLTDDEATEITSALNAGVGGGAAAATVLPIPIPVR